MGSLQWKTSCLLSIRNHFSVYLSQSQGWSNFGNGVKWALMLVHHRGGLSSSSFLLDPRWLIYNWEFGLLANGCPWDAHFQIPNYYESINPFMRVWSLSWASTHWAVRRLTTRSREVSKPRDSGLDFSNRSEIWPALRQQRCWDAYQISERYDHYNTQSRGFEISRGLAVRHLTLSE